MADKPEMIPVDTRVGAGLHPHSVIALETYDDDTAGYVHPAYEALEAAYRGVQSVHEARAAASNDPTLNEAGVVIAAQEVAHRIFARTAKVIDTTVSNFRKTINYLEGELSKPIEAQASHQISMEIRAHMKGLTPEERHQLLQRAINGGDMRTASAVLGGPSYLSGLTDEMQAAMTRVYHEKNEPLKAKRLRALQGALGLLMDRGGLLHTELERAVGMAPHKVKALRERKQHSDKLRQSA